MGKQWKQWQTFSGSKITADRDCSHEIKRHLLLGRKVMINLDRLFKSRDITLPTKIPLVKAMVFLGVMYGYESWTIKKAEHEEFMFLSCGAGEESWEFLELQGDPICPPFFFFLLIFILFYFSFIFISWRLITLQYCSDFFHTLTWISHGFTCIPHPNPPPTSLSTRFL